MSVEIVPQYREGESAGKGFNILVAEDEPNAQKFLSIILKSFKLSVEIALDGREVIEKVKKDPYDLILMDLQMPVMGGVEATKVIREQLHETLPILALTATENDKEKCLAAGMNDYLTKPIEVSELKDKIFYWLKGVSQGGPVNRKKKRAMKWDKQRGNQRTGYPRGVLPRTRSWVHEAVYLSDPRP
ncbi:MAG: response regulator [Candidatus Omnitrophota bacterium]